MADSYAKLSSSPAGEGETVKGPSEGSRRAEKVDKSGVQKCCGLFSIKAGFYLYGVMDLIIFIFVTVLLVKSKIGGRNVEDLKWLLAVFLVQLPNVSLFIMVLVDDKSTTRRIYSSYMMIKMLVQSIAIPMLILRLESKFLFDKVCGDLLNLQTDESVSTVGLSGMAPAANLTVIEQADFSDASPEMSELQVFATDMARRMVGFTARGLQVLKTQYVDDADLPKMEVSMCQEGLLYVSFFIFAFFQLLTGYQMYIARVHLMNKVLQEKALKKEQMKAQIKEVSDTVNLQKLQDQLTQFKLELEKKALEDKLRMSMKSLHKGATQRFAIN